MPRGAPHLPLPQSESAFVTEHYWGYTRQRDGGTVEYEVTHAPWRVWTVDDVVVEVDALPLYGASFATIFAGPPASALVAEGSAVKVFPPNRMPEE
jgi:hypothetical protein